ncbi:MAG: sulfatase-like hydrolase/transferase [Pseudomonadota bacterium]
MNLATPLRTLQYFVVAVLLLSLLISNKAMAELQNQEKPNIVMVLLDDLDEVTTGPYFQDVLQESFREIAEQGVQFENSFISTPVCCPSRAAILSGKYAHNTGVFNNGTFSNEDISSDLGQLRGGRQLFLDDENRALPVLLKQAGYHTIITGKYMSGVEIQKPNGLDVEEQKRQLIGLKVDGISSQVSKTIHDIPMPSVDESWVLPKLPPGWDTGIIFDDDLGGRRKYAGYNYYMIEWDPSMPDGKAHFFGDDSQPNEKTNYSTDVVFDKTIDYLEKAKKSNDEQPFFAYVNPTCPHLPLPPAKRHLEKALKKWGDPESILRSRRPNYLSAGDSMKDKPSWFQMIFEDQLTQSRIGWKTLVSLGAYLPPLRTDELNWNSVDFFNRMGSLYACDEGIKNVIDWLKKNNEWQNTVFIFYSDNGYNLGAHGLKQKRVPYEEAINVPLWVAGGAKTGIQKGVINRHSWLVNIDIAPTLLDFAGAPIPSDMDGMSFKQALLHSSDFDIGRTEVLVQYMNNSFAHFDINMWQNIRGGRGAIPSYFAIRKKTPDNPKGYFLIEWETVSETTQPEGDDLFAFDTPTDETDYSGVTFANLGTQYIPHEYEFYDFSNPSARWQLDNQYPTTKAEKGDLINSLIDSLHSLRQCQGSSCQR